MVNGDEYFDELIYGNDVTVRNSLGQEKRYINFDNAATTPPFKGVIDSLTEYMKYYSSVDRGVGYKSFISSKIFEDSRENIMEFLGASSSKGYTAIFDENTTHCLNMIARMIIKDKSDVVICTRMEHHSNDLPWRRYATIKYVDVDEKGKLNKNEFEELSYKYRDRLRVITVTGASNVTGYINDIYDIASIAHKYNALIVVDGAQLVPHKNISVCNEDSSKSIDFISFSAHKMFAPFGIGVIIGRKDIVERCEPMMPGGGTVDIVGRNVVFWEHAPKKHEGGTQNIAGVVALDAAINEMRKIGFDVIEERERNLENYFTKNIQDIDGVKIYYDPNEINRVPVCTFGVEGYTHREVGSFLGDEKCIGVRTGCFCAQVYMKILMGLKDTDTFIYAIDKNLKSPGLIRVSLAFYNTTREIDYFMDSLYELIERKK